MHACVHVCTCARAHVHSHISFIRLRVPARRPQTPRHRVTFLFPSFPTLLSLSRSRLCSKCVRTSQRAAKEGGGRERAGERPFGWEGRAAARERRGGAGGSRGGRGGTGSGRGWGGTGGRGGGRVDEESAAGSARTEQKKKGRGDRRGSWRTESRGRGGGPGWAQRGAWREREGGQRRGEGGKRRGRGHRGCGERAKKKKDRKREIDTHAHTHTHTHMHTCARAECGKGDAKRMGERGAGRRPLGGIGGHPPEFGRGPAGPPSREAAIRGV